MGKTIIGIDPGSKGFLAVLKPDGGREYMAIEGHDPHEIAAFIQGFVETSEVVAVMEEIHAVFGSSANSTFSFGEIFGLLKGLLIASGVPYHLVPPKTWQGEIWVNDDKVYKAGKVNPKTGKVTKSVDTKPTSINAARRLFPGLDFRKTEKCKNIDDNKVDATLLVEYARRRNL